MAENDYSDYVDNTLDNAIETNSSFSDAVEAGRDAATDNAVSESFGETWNDKPSWYDGPWL